MTRVLLVGAEYEGVMPISAMLETAEIDVTICDTAVDALVRLDDEAFDCVLATASLPATNGVRFLQRTQRRRDGVGAILLVDPGDLDLLNRAATTDIDAVLSYTADLDHLISTISQLNVSRRAATSGAHQRTLLRALFRGAESAIAARARDELERSICEELVAVPANSIAWTTEYDSNAESVRPRTAAGIDDSALSTRSSADISWADVLVEPADGEPKARVEVTVPLSDGACKRGTIHVVSETSPTAREREWFAQFGRIVETELSRIESLDGSPLDHTAVTRFSGAITHELSNQLQVARGALDAVRNSSDGDHVDTLETVFDRLDRLAAEAKTVATERVADGALSVREIESTATTAWDRVDNGRATLTVVDSVPIRADHDALELLFENLFRNGIDHGGTDVAIRVGTLEERGGGFYVEDTGPGIAAAERDRVFDWGYTADGDSGFGLPIVERVVRAHGWTIGLAEGESGGARFEVTGASIVNVSLTSET